MSKDFGLKKYNPSDWKPHEDLVKMLNSADFVLAEYDRNTMVELWSKYATQSKTPNDRKIDWKENNLGLWWQIGEFGKMPISLEFSITVMDGVVVLNYNPTSMVVHFEMINRWMAEHCPAYADKRYADSSNFHQLLWHLDKVATKAA